MNYGFEPDDARERLELEPGEEDDRFCMQLYDYVAGATNLNGLQVLEVGSGRGGGAAFVSRRHQPSQMTGVDFSARAVELCNERQSADGLNFVTGDAEALPFDDQSFDAVLNVESSHCYGSMPRFLSEVHRVLKDGGHFLFADFRPPTVLEQLLAQIAAAGLSVGEHEDITANVLRAMELDSERKQRLIAEHVSSWLSGTFQQFAGVRNSDVYRSFQDSQLAYIRVLASKS